MEDNPKAPESNGLEELVALMQENNRSTAEIERDGRNTRRHLLEMKKIQQASLDMSDSVNTGFENFFETMNANKLGDEESATERASIFEEIRDELTEIREGGLDTRSDDSKGSSGGMMGGAGKLLGGAGMGIGAAAAGIAAVFASSAFLLDTLEDMDGKKIVANVKDLLEIAKLPGEEGDALKVMGTLGAIGTGLAFFGIGAFFAKTASDDTAQEVKKSVGTYLGIAQLPGEKGDSARVMGTLLALGGGLAMFGVGSFFANAASEDQAKVVKKSVAALLSIAEDPNIGGGQIVSDDLKVLGRGLIDFGVGSFFAKASGENQGQVLKDNVSALLSIAEDPNADEASLLRVTAALKVLGGGLIDFGVGSFFAKASGENQGQSLKDNVTALLSIAEDPNANKESIQKATVALKALGVGLGAFGVGSFFAGIGDAVLSGESIKNEVLTLLSIGGSGDIDKIGETVLALTALGAGLLAFGTGSFVGSLAGAASAVLDFFSGGESPIKQAIELGENSDAINAGVNSLTMFREELDRFSDMGSISADLGLEAMAEDLLAASKLIKIAVDGGTDFRGSDTDYVGLANVKGVEESVVSINKLKGALNMEMSDGTSIDTNRNTTGALNMEMSDGTSIDTNRNTTGAGLMSISAENVDLRTNQTPVQAAASNIISSPDNRKNSNTSVFLKPATPDRTAAAVSMR